MKWILKNNTNKPLVRVFCFLFLIYQPYLLPVPSLSGLPCLPFMLAIRITSIWLWHYVSLPWWWRQVFCLFWNEMVIVIVLLKVGDKKVPCTSALTSTRQARGLGIFCRARKPCVPWVHLWPCSLVSAAALLSLSGRLCVMCQPFREKT